MRKAILLVSLGSLLALVASQTASATHPYPANNNSTLANKIAFSVVPASKACTAPNRTHALPGIPPGPPTTADGSCAYTATSPTSPNLTTGTATLHKGVASLTIEVICTNAQAPPCPAPGDQQDVKLTADSTDIRCKAGISAAAAAAVCPNENGAPAGKVGNDYTGEVQGNAQIRITDTLNSPPAGSHATVLDLPFPVHADCTGTPADPTIGSECNALTSADATVPGVVKENQKAIVNIGQIFVNDGGPDGDIDSAPNSLFTVQGLFIP